MRPRALPGSVPGSNWEVLGGPSALLGNLRDVRRAPRAAPRLFQELSVGSLIGFAAFLGGDVFASVWRLLRLLEMFRVLFAVKDDFCFC